ncbi:MAG: hypothetical protein GWP59_08790 [Chlamydiales bacterium]|nr:hypothetical protein [Chlamydiales bacterium]NCF71782.1 hypothetical protein [Chlamydiales bacterium]
MKDVFKDSDVFTLKQSKEVSLKGVGEVINEVIQKEKKINSYCLQVIKPCKEISEFLDALADEYGMSSKNYLLYDKRYEHAPRAYAVATGKGRTPIKSFLRPFLVNMDKEQLTTENLNYNDIQVGGVFFNSDLLELITKEVQEFLQFWQLLEEA